MDNWYHILALTLSTLLPITNPLGNAAIFISLTSDQDMKRRRQQALWGAIYMFVLLEVFFLGGTFILKFFGIELDGIRIAGGILIAKIGFDQLQAAHKSAPTPAEHAEASEKEDISFTPLAMPLLSGPGAIAAVIGISSTVTSSVFNYGIVSIGIVLTALTCWIVLRQSDSLIGFLGVNGANALTKIMGFLLLCIGVQLAINGFQQVLRTVWGGA